MLQKLPGNSFEWIEDTSQFNEDFIKNYNEESDEVLFNILKYYMNLIMIYHFYLKIEKVKKLVTNLHDKTEFVSHIRNLKQVLNHGLITRIVHRVIKFSQKAWLKPYIDINTKLRQKAKNNFDKDCSSSSIKQF